MNEIKQYSQEIKDYLREFESYEALHNNLIAKLKEIDKSYQRGDFGYKRYQKLRNNILSGENEETVIQDNKTIMLSILDRIDALLAKQVSVLSELKIPSSKLTIKQIEIKSLPSIDEIDLEVRGFKDTKYTAPAPKIGETINFSAKGQEEPKPPLEIVPEKKEIKLEPLQQRDDKITESLKAGKQKKDVKFDKPLIDAPAPRPKEDLTPPLPKKLTFPKNIIYKFQAREKPFLDNLKKSRFIRENIMNLRLVRYLLARHHKQFELPDEIGIESMGAAPTIFDYDESAVKAAPEDILSKDVAIDPYLLERELDEIKNLISAKDVKTYSPNPIGYFANLSVKRLSMYFITKFPEFFRTLYLAIRFANINLLSNTYINIMFMLTILTFVLNVPLLFTFFSMQQDIFLFAFIKTLIISLVLSSSVFGFMWYYPFMKKKSRRRSINTNLPFAIDHMYSVITSGVPPSTMFKLISNSSEYGEISVEIQKISNYVEVFGYDLLTAIRAVSAITPSEQLKEFFDGFLSTIETGGNLKQYLQGKSKEALLAYKFERQKYIEALSTYSDIYTGVLIAAPLFFVTVLSLVSMLGGSVGGLSVSVIMSVGTYLVIPVLNIGFIIFLEVNQPEI